MENERGEFDNFFTGLSSQHGTKPGFTKNNESFSIKFLGISPDDRIKPQLMRFIQFKFETCYSWSNVMDIALECLENYYEDSELQDDVELCVSEWLGQFEGWGLLFTLLPMDFQKFLLVLYAQLKHKYEEENIEKSNEDLYEDMLSFYQQETRGLPLKQLTPKVEVELLNIVGGVRENERDKLLRIKFLSSRFHLASDFIVHKKVLRRNLVEISAEVVAQTCQDVEDLEIPETLKGIVIEKVIDADWVASYWFAKYRENRVQVDGRNEKLTQSNEAKQVGNFGSFVFSTLRNISRGLFGLLETIFSLLNELILSDIKIMGEILKLPVDLLHIISPENISVRISHPNVLSLFHQLHRDIQQFCFYEKKEMLKTIDTAEGSCLVKHSSVYYRGLVLPSSSAASKVRVRLVDIGKEKLFHPREVLELPEVFAQLSAFSFSVSPSLNPGQHFQDFDRSLETIGDLLENAPNLYLEKRGEIVDHHDGNILSVEISWTEKVCDGPMDPFYTREVFLSDELAKRGILISDNPNKKEEKDNVEEVTSRTVEDYSVKSYLPRTKLTVEPGSVVDCSVQALLFWNLAVVHLNNSATRQALTQICDGMENRASTFPRVANPRPGMLVSYHQQTIGWVRGKILNVTTGALGRPEFLVNLLDYGIKEIASQLESFRILPRKLRQFPILAVLVKLPLVKTSATSDSVLFRQMEKIILKQKERTRVRILSSLPSLDHNTLVIQGHLLDSNNFTLYDIMQ